MDAGRRVNKITAEVLTIYMGKLPVWGGGGGPPPYKGGLGGGGGGGGGGGTPHMKWVLELT